MKWLDIIPESGVMGILGKRRQGKTALAYYIAEERHHQLGVPAAVLGPPLSMARSFPNWFRIVTDLQAFSRFPDHTLILDEGSLPLHSRQSLSREHTTFDQTLSLCGQRHQLFIFNTHHSRKLDPLVVEEYEVLAFKFPGKMHTRMERREIRTWSEIARDALVQIPEADRKRWSYVFYDDLEEEVALLNPLPSFWSDEVSAAVSIAMQPTPLSARDALLEVDSISSALFRSTLDIWRARPELTGKIVQCAEALKPVVRCETEWSADIGRDALAKLEECFVFENVPMALVGLRQRLMQVIDDTPITMVESY